MRRDFDAYQTLQADKLYAPLAVLLGDQVRGRVIEPCAGDRHLVRAIQKYSKNVTEVIEADIQDESPVDAVDSKNWEGVSCSWVITNPPFNYALPILKNSFDCCNIGVAFLLRITFIEPTLRDGSIKGRPLYPRNEWHQKSSDNLRYVIPVNPRPRFMSDEGNNGTDSATVAWFVYQKKFSWRSLGLMCPFQFITAWR